MISVMRPAEGAMYAMEPKPDISGLAAQAT